jgi:uncharacterized repeat protein (TIGR01451 family)
LFVKEFITDLILGERTIFGGAKMSKNQIGKFPYVLMLFFLAVAMAACCCESPPSTAECNATLEQQVNGFNTSYAGATISIKKSSNVQYFTAVGQVINYTYTITNNSSKNFKNLQVQDDKVAVTCPASQGLNANQSVTCTGVYTVTDEDYDAKEIHNTASAEATQTKKYTCNSSTEVINKNASYTAQASTSLTIELDVRPALSLAKTVDPAFYSGGQWVTYTYTLTNTGNMPLTPPFSINDDKVPSGWSCDPETELQPNNSMQCHADYLIDAGLRWTITNTAIACGYFEDQQVCSDPASASVLFRQPIVDPEPLPPPPPPPAGYCGDGIIQSPETCDPPNGWDCGSDCQGL